MKTRRKVWRGDPQPGCPPSAAGKEGARPSRASSFITGKTGREEEGFVAALTPATCSLKGVSLPFLLEP